ncbi:MAG TPA: discoidin domain-containing protein, partial [Gemmatimonadaceae bacterium]|nr:discoidin domain-containing protein [Gemmatimonadaceae bacterium]
RALRAFADSLRATLSHDLASQAHRSWRVTGDRTATLDLDLGAPVDVGVARLEEDIGRGQRVARYTLQGAVDGGWRTMSHGSTIGYTKLDRFDPVQVRRVRLVIEDAVDAPQPIRLGLYPSPS